MKKSKGNLHAPMGQKEAALDRDGNMTPHYVEHKEKVGVVPRPASNGYHTSGSGIPIAPSPEVHDRMPSNPQGADGFVEHSEKTKTQGHADHESARGRKYEYSEVKDAAAHLRSEHVPLNEDAGSIGSSGNKSRRPNTRCPENISSFGGKKYKA